MRWSSPASSRCSRKIRPESSTGSPTRLPQSKHVTLARAGRLLLLVAFLAAQQVAVAHEVWHAAKAQSSEQSQFCGFHAALGTVSGALNGFCNATGLADFQHVSFVSADSAVITAHRLSPSSRDPPPLF